MIDCRASREVAGTDDVEIEEWPRFCPARVISGVTMKPGVRFVVYEEDARSRAIDCSRRAFAFSLLSS